MTKAEAMQVIDELVSSIERLRSAGADRVEIGMSRSAWEETQIALMLCVLPHSVPTRDEWADVNEFHFDGVRVWRPAVVR